MSSSDEANGVRWTPNRIRKALAVPKPKGAIRGMWDYEMGRLAHRPARTPLELRILQHVADNADVLNVPPANPDQLGAPDGWLLVPAPQWLIDALATFGTEMEDLEPDEDREVDDIREPDVDDEPDADLEHDGLVVTRARRARYRKTAQRMWAEPQGERFVPLSGNQPSKGKIKVYAGK